ncbi:hypothetical protein [Promicromonospora sp. NPDC060271]
MSREITANVVVERLQLDPHLLARSRHERRQHLQRRGAGTRLDRRDSAT